MSLEKVDILGAGWSSTFLIPLCKEQQISHAATSRDGQFSSLPDANTVFSIRVSGGLQRLVRHFQKTHTGGWFLRSWGRPVYGITTRLQSLIRKQTSGAVGSGMVWYDRQSEFDNPRANAETELLALSHDTPTTVLDLCGLWGGSRRVRHWVGTVAPTKEALKMKIRAHILFARYISP